MGNNERMIVQKTDTQISCVAKSTKGELSKIIMLFFPELLLQESINIYYSILLTRTGKCPIF